MKLVLYIHSLGSGGAERVAVTLANHWAEEGWDITIATNTSVQKDFYPLHSTVKRAALSLDQKSTGIGAALWNNYSRIRTLRRLLLRERPDVAVGFMTGANVLLALANIGTGIKSIGSEHIHPPQAPYKRAWHWLRNRTYVRLDAVTALTEETSNWIKHNTNARRVPVIPNPIAYPIAVNEPVVPPQNFYNPSKEHLLLAVGRLTEQKGFDDLLAAFAIASRHFPHWKLVILGEGGLRRALEAHVEALGLSGKVYLPGAVGNIGEWYAAAALYVMSSRYEGFGNTLAEAMTYGVPVVSFDCDTGPRDIVRHEVDGLLVPTGDKDSLVAAMERLMGSETERKKLAARAIETRERFSVDKIAGMWERLFKELG